MRRRREPTDVEVAYLRKAWHDPEITNEAIKVRLRVYSDQLYRWARELGLGARRTVNANWSDERTDELLRLHRLGLTGSEIARAMGETKNAVNLKLWRLRKAGVPVDQVEVTTLDPEYLAMLRRVAAWDAAAAKGLAAYERQVSSC